MSLRYHRDNAARIHGFTLIELLVVIAVVSVLAAIVTPVFAGARENARKAVCLSNLRQVGLGIAMYAQDYDENIVHTELGGDIDAAHEYYWGDMLQPYVRSWQTLTCPSEVKPLHFKSGVTAFSQPWSYHYGLNDIVAADCASAVQLGCRHIGAAGQSDSAIAAPTTTIVIAESCPADGETGYNPTAYGGTYTPGYTRHEINWQWDHRDATRLAVDGRIQDGYPRHHDGFELVMADGHSKWRRRDHHTDGTFTQGTRDGEWLANVP